MYSQRHRVMPALQLAKSRKAIVTRMKQRRSVTSAGHYLTSNSLRSADTRQHGAKCYFVLNQLERALLCAYFPFGSSTLPTGTNFKKQQKIMIRDYVSQSRYYVSHEGDCYAVYSHQATLRLPPDDYDIFKGFDLLTRLNNMQGNATKEILGHIPITTGV